MKESKILEGPELREWRNAHCKSIDFVAAVAAILGTPISVATISMAERNAIDMATPRAKIQRALKEIEAVSTILGPVSAAELLSEIKRRARARSARVAAPSRATANTAA
jgi:hypothetical protein